MTLKKKTTEEFIKKARTIHGDKYDYSKAKYVNAISKICIVCPTHGEFWQRPFIHLSSKGCPICGIEKRIIKKTKTTEQFIEEAKKVHGDKYDYSKVEYNGCFKKICIICPEHGEFWQTPDLHLQGKGCRKCGYEKNSINRTKAFEQFVNEARQLHGDKYDYSMVEYKGCETKVCIICPIHGEFWQTPSNHIHGRGCKKCSKELQQMPNLERNKKAKSTFIEKSRKIHNDKYDYSKVEYVNSHTKVCIICPEHGEFWQTPSNHLNNKGCPSCNESKLEQNVRNTLEENKIEYIYQKHFSWLGKQSLDFYLPQHNLAIECQGEQHYKPVDFAGKGNEWAKKLFERTIKRDKIKLDKVLKHDIKMIYVNEENKDNFLNGVL